MLLAEIHCLFQFDMSYTGYRYVHKFTKTGKLYILKKEEDD